MVKWASCDTGARRVTEVVWSGCPVARFGRIVGSKDLAGGDPVHSLESPLIASGTHDGTGAGDHDQPYRFGRRPRASATYPFSTRQYVRLLLLRSRIQAGLRGYLSQRRADQSLSSHL